MKILQSFLSSFAYSSLLLIVTTFSVSIGFSNSDPNELDPLPPNLSVAYELSDCKEEAALLEYNLHNIEPVDECDVENVYLIDSDNACHLEESRSALELAMLSSETLPAGTLIIAMDEALQDGNEDRVRKAYGLAVHLLHAEVPLKWIINSTKTSRTETDFSASARRLYPTASGYSTRNFRSGPIAIFPGFEAEAQTVIDSYGNDIRVYELQSATMVDVNTNLTHKPKVGVLNGSNEDIHINILESAGLVDDTHFEDDVEVDSLDDMSCFTFASEPHEDNVSASEINGVKEFVRSGGNFLAQCAAVRAYQDGANGVRLFTNAGFVDEPGLGTFLYDNPTEPFAQFEGTIPDQGGSLKDFSFTTDPPGGTRIVHDSDNDFKTYVGRIDGFTGSAGGYVHYMGGHSYNDLDADRMYLNAMLRSADRPDICNLNLGPTALDDNGTIDCGTNSIVIDVLDNDMDPLGGTLTVNNLGTGSQGTFVNNNDGTVTYTPNNGSWNGPDVVTYEACSGTLCDQASITISSSTPTAVIINGTVFDDTDQDGILDGGESGPSSVTVNLYEDVNNDNMIDGGDVFITSQSTLAGGGFSFSILTSPSTTTTSTLTSSKATGNYEGNNDEGYGSCTENFIDEDNGELGYFFVEFDLSSLPIGCTVNSANLRLVRGNDGSGDNFDFQVRKVTNSWTEGNGDCNDSGSNTSGVTWDQRSPNVDWTTPGGDFAGTVYATDNGGDDDPEGTVYNLSVTALVNEWLSGTTNQGLAILPSTVNASGGTDWFTFYSDDAAEANRPKLEVTVTCTDASSYVLSIDTGTLPTGSTLTTDNVEEATFTALGQLNCDNDFGFITCVPLDPGTNGTLTICEGETVTASELFTSLLGTPDTGGAWTPALAGAGTYTYTHLATATCPEVSAVVVVTEQTAPVAGTTTDFTICVGDTVTLAELNMNITGNDAGVWGPLPLAGGATYTYTVSGGAYCSDATVIVVVDEEICTGTISGHLYTDTNGNGTQDAGEPDLANLNVLVTDGNGVMQTVTSDLNGDWTATVPPGMTTADVDESDPEYPTGSIQTEGDDPTTVTAVAGSDVDAGNDGYFFSVPELKVIMNETGRSVVLDEFITYDIIVTNTGNVLVTDIDVTDDNATILTGNPIANLAIGGSALVTARHQITQGDIDLAYVENTAFATGDSPYGTNDVTDISDTGTDINGDPIPNPEAVASPNGDGTPGTIDAGDDPTVTSVLPPDLTPTIKASRNQMNGTTNFNIFIRITELKVVDTDGLISVRVPVDARWSLDGPFDPALTLLGTTPLDNSDWSYSIENDASGDPAYHLFSSTEVIPSGGFSMIGFKATWDAGQTQGVYTITAQLEEGSGSENRIDNSADAERIEYIIEF